MLPQLKGILFSPIHFPIMNCSRVASQLIREFCGRLEAGSPSIVIDDFAHSFWRKHSLDHGQCLRPNRLGRPITGKVVECFESATSQNRLGCREWIRSWDEWTIADNPMKSCPTNVGGWRFGLPTHPDLVAYHERNIPGDRHWIHWPIHFVNGLVVAKGHGDSRDGIRSSSRIGSNRRRIIQKTIS